MKEKQLNEVWIEEKYLYLISNDLSQLYQKPVDGMSAIQT
jgi:hypothetical protein